MMLSVTLSSTSPSAEYNSFIASSEFLGAPKAAEAASAAVYNERASSSFPNQEIYSNAAKIAGANELKSPAVSAAARADISELLMADRLMVTHSL